MLPDLLISTHHHNTSACRSRTQNPQSLSAGKTPLPIVACSAEDCQASCWGLSHAPKLQAMRSHDLEAEAPLLAQDGAAEDEATLR